jgi:hypothetical protein
VKGVKDMKKLLTIGLLLMMVMIVSCAKPPQQAIDSAKAALEKAKSMEAETYAQNSLRDAEDAQAALQAELAAQQKKFALFRNYDKTSILAQTAMETAKKTEEDAIANKQQAKIDADNAINAARAAIAKANEDILNAPKEKGSQLEVEQFKAYVDGANTTLAEAEGLISSERFYDAKAKAEAAQNAAENVSTEIQKAREMKESLKKGR